VQPKLEIRAVYSPYDCCLNVVSVSHPDVMSGGIAECDSITVQLYKECHFVSLGKVTQHRLPLDTTAWYKT
jgi:hypothetical protein